MRVSYQWLKEFVDLKIPPQALAEKLVLGGIEVETVESLEGDSILEIAIPPNRADLMSHRGLAREISALAGVKQIPFKTSKVLFPRKGEGQIRIKIQDPKLCSRYTGALLQGLLPSASPSWMLDRLEKCGIRSIHPLVDITNYVLLETGQPLHAFDAQKLKGSLIEVRTAQEKEKLMTIDHREFSLDKNSLVIADAERAIALAGIIGGLETEIDSGITDVFIESAYFSPISIRRTARAYGIRTESSQRFERGVDPEGVSLGLTRALELLLKISPCELKQRIDISPISHRSPKLKFRKSRLSGILGPEYKIEEVHRCFKALDCQVKPEKEGAIIIPPSYRRDLEQEIDLIEEFARWKGYETIPDAIPPIPFQKISGASLYDTVTLLKEWMKYAGFFEMISYPYIGKSDLHGLRIEKAIPLQNPLSEEQGELRPLLAPSLIQSAKYHLDRKMLDLRLFEIGKTFTFQGEKICENLKLGVLWSGLRWPEQWGAEKSPADLFDLKGLLEKLLSEFYHRPSHFKGGPLFSFLHPENSLRIFQEGEELGYLGELHPEIQREKELYQALYLFEIDLEKLGPLSRTEKKYQPLSRHPWILRDFSFILPNKLKYEEVFRICQQFKGSLLKDFWLFDLYRGSKIPAGSRSLTLRFFFQSQERNLTEGEVECCYQSIKDRFTQEFAIEARSINRKEETSS